MNKREKETLKQLEAILPKLINNYQAAYSDDRDEMPELDNEFKNMWKLYRELQSINMPDLNDVTKMMNRKINKINKKQIGE